MILAIFQIVDVETGKTLEANREGEVWIRGPQVTSGYLNLPAATKEMFLQDGWVRTGSHPSDTYRQNDVPTGMHITCIRTSRIMILGAETPLRQQDTYGKS